MTQPTSYKRGYSFTDFSSGSPSSQPPGDKLDSEYDAVAETLAGVLANLELLQRDDGALRNGLVGVDQLNSTVLALIGSEGFIVRGEWETSISYAQGDIVSDDSVIYLTMKAHVSGALATDVAAGRMVAIFDTGAVALENKLALATGLAMIGSTGGINAQAALDLKASTSTLALATGLASIGAQGFANAQLALDSKVAIADLDSSDTGKGAGMVRVSENENLAEILAQEFRLTTYGAVFDLDPADPDSATDNAPAFDAAFAAMRAAGGGTLIYPPGLGATRSMVDIPCDVPILTRGSGQRKNYPDDLVAGARQPSTIVPLHSGRCAFRFRPTVSGQGGFVGEKWNVATLLSSANQNESASTPDCAFGWDCAAAFYYGATFRNMGIHNFRKSGQGSAFDTYVTGVMTATGAILIEDCHINFNNWVWRNLDNSWTNALRFLKNKAGKNGRGGLGGGLYARGPDCAINNNVIEDTYNAIDGGGPFADFEAVGNYFEANTGSACIRVRECYNYRIGPNNYTTMNYANIDHKVILTGVNNGVCIDTHWSNVVYKGNPPFVGNVDRVQLKNTATQSTFARVDDFNGKSWAQKPEVKSLRNFYATTGIVKEVDPQTSAPIPVDTYTTSGAGSVSYSTSGVLSGAIDDWLVMSWLVKRMTDSPAGMYVTFNVNSGGQTQSFSLPNWPNYFRVGEFGLVTVAVRLSVAITGAVAATCYPYGQSPTAGLVSRQTWPSLYTVDDVNKIRPWLDSHRVKQIGGNPTTGTWELANELIDGSNGVRRYCSVGGTPGTWNP